MSHTSNRPLLPPPIARTFCDAVDSLRFGALGTELTDELIALTNKCQETGRAGSITLTIKIKPGKGGQLEIEDDIKTKLPKPERGSTMMFATIEGHLSRADPRQAELPGIRMVDVGHDGKVHNVDTSPPPVRSAS
jgi:hypothetical protein